MRFYDFTVNFDKPAAEIKATPGDDLAEAHWIDIGKLADVKMTEPMKKSLKSLGYL